MADILSQEEIDALLSATEGDELPEKAEPPEDVEERRREALRGLFVRTEKYSFQTRKYIRKYSDEEIPVGGGPKSTPSGRNGSYRPGKPLFD